MGKAICYQCGNVKFGMVRYYRLGKVFCKMSCRNNYVYGRERTPLRQYEVAEEKPPDELVKLLKYPP